MDKVQKIREEVERLKSLIGNNSFLSDYEKGFNDGREDICDNLISFIDSLQEEPKFKTGDRIKPIDSCLGSPRTIVDICNSWYITDQGTLDFEYEDNWEAVEEPVSDGLEEASKNYALNNTPWDDCKDEIQESFKAGANWQKAKDESTTEDLGEYINELSKQFPEVSFAKLSRIAVRVAKWQKQKDQAIIELAEDHAMLAGMEKMKEEMKAKAYNGEVVATSDNGWESVRVYKKKEHSCGQKVKVIVIKEE